MKNKNEPNPENLDGEKKPIIDRVPPSNRMRDQAWFWPVTISVIVVTLGLVVLGAWAASTFSQGSVILLRGLLGVL